MGEIIVIEGNQVKIGTEDGKIVTVPIATLNFANPGVGDKVKIYQDEENIIVKREGVSAGQSGSAEGVRKVNKHVFVWVGNFLFGGFGVDRFLRGQVGLGIVKLFFGWLTLGIWPLVDWIISIVKAYGEAYGSVENITFTASGAYTK